MNKILLGILVFMVTFTVANAQSTIWFEDFSCDDGTTMGGGSPSKWSINISECSIIPPNDWFEVRSNRMEGCDLDGEAVWISQIIDISGYSDVSISVEVSETGTMENSDYVKIAYVLDQSSETLLSTNGNLNDDFVQVTAQQSGLSGSQLQLFIRLKNNAGTERHRFDNILVQGNASRSADLAISKCVDQASPMIGDVVTYTITTNNSGPDEVTGVSVLDTLPTGLTFNTAQPERGTYDPDTGIWNVGTLLANQSATLEIRSRVKSGGLLINLARIIGGDEDDPNLANNSAGVTIEPRLPAPVADFQANVQIGMGTLMVQFQNLSSNATDWEWNFGDGTSSNEESPMHCFTYNDCVPDCHCFTVSLKAMGAGGEDLVTKQNFITVYSPPRAEFELSAQKICSGTVITLKNQTCGAAEQWELDWGDGTIESGGFPLTGSWSHEYKTTSPCEIFSIKLMVVGKGVRSSRSHEIEVFGPIMADFTVSDREGIAPLEVQFSDLSKGWINTWFWDFGDGTTSDEPHPVHCFSGWPKHPTVTLKVTGPCGEATLVKKELLTINHAVKVLFEAAPLAGVPGMRVQFTNNTGGNANIFNWDYGDHHLEETRSDMGHKAHPAHIYQQPGEFDVTLQARGNGGADTLCLPGLIYVDSLFQYLDLELICSGSTYPGLDWNNAVDHDIYGAGSQVMATADDGWAIFKVKDANDGSLHKIRLLTDSVAPRESVTDLLEQFEIWVSLDGVDFGNQPVFCGNSVQKRGRWETYILDEPVPAKYIKVVLCTSRGKNARYREFSEIQFFAQRPGFNAKPSPTLSSEIGANTPKSYCLLANYPNPFNPRTTLGFELPEPATIDLSIFNLQGQLVRRLAWGEKSAGQHSFVWNGRNLWEEAVANGVYIYKLQIQAEHRQICLTRKMIVLR